MDHDETREQLELAALEPGGLERLMAGDTPAAQAVAGHLAGCRACTDELVRLRRSSEVIRSGLREMTPPDLRARTLAAIRAEGVRRPLAATVAVMPLAETSAGAAGAAGVSPPSTVTTRRRGWSALPMIATIAAAIVLSVIATSLLVGSRLDDQLAHQTQTIHELEEVATMSMDVSAQADAQHVQLAGVSDPTLGASLVFSPSTTDLVITTTDLAKPAAGYEYRCWVEIGGKRERIGRMFFGDDLAYWGGPVPAVADASSTTTFGISLVAASATSIDAQPVLIGTE
jgi:hypothetical protein